MFGNANLYTNHKNWVRILSGNHAPTSPRSPTLISSNHNHFDLTKKQLLSFIKEIMSLRVVHLLRKTERIDRDLEELDSLLNSLQMDREYSGRLRDSLVDESFRLRQLKQKINSQVIRIPAQIESFVQETISKKPIVTQVQPKQIEPEKISQIQPKTEPTKELKIDTVKQDEIVNQSTLQPSKNQSSKTTKPPFLFRFE